MVIIQNLAEVYHWRVQLKQINLVQKRMKTQIKYLR